MARNSMKSERVPPSAAMLIESMRDIGYSLSTALADVIDNSISSGAKKVDIFANANEDGGMIGVLDDGSGMSREELMLAMRPGSRNPLEARRAHDLGRFGLGLKTASFSQCRHLTVLTRKAGETSAAIWDLQHVAATDEWLVLIPSDLDEIPWANRLGSHGTLVLWRDLDRIVENAGTKIASQQFNRAVDEARENIEIVFHRYLNGDAGIRRLTVTLNNRELEGVDPFNSGHPATQVRAPETIKCGKSKVTVQCFTLPHHSKVSPAEWDKYAGKAGYIKNQGFYLYREKRLIVHGTWFGLARQQELTKLARVRIDIPNNLDTDWKIDVKKASAQLPYIVRERLKLIIDTLSHDSKRVYKSRGAKRASDQRLPVWNRFQNKDEISYRINPEHPVVTALLEAAGPELRTGVNRLLDLVSSTIPVDAIYSDLGSNPEQLTGKTISDDVLRHTLITVLDKLSAAKLGGGTIREMLKHTEPFRSNWERAEPMLCESIPKSGDAT
jgi:hypothetical protein